MKHTIIDFKSMVESVRKDGRRHDYKIDKMLVYNDFLYYKRKYIDNINFKEVEYFLFPKQNIGVYKLYLSDNPKSEPSFLYKYYVDMLKVEKHKEYWDSKDLYLDFISKVDGKYYVVDVDEFNDAIKKGELDSSDITSALNGLDSVLKGYYENFDIESYICKLKMKYEVHNELIYEYIEAP